LINASRARGWPETKPGTAAVRPVGNTGEEGGASRAVSQPPAATRCRSTIKSVAPAAGGGDSWHRARAAPAQTEAVVHLLQVAWPGLTCKMRTMVTQGDRTQASGEPLPSIGGKGLFTLELDRALREGEIDSPSTRSRTLADRSRARRYRRSGASRGRARLSRRTAGSPSPSFERERSWARVASAARRSSGRCDRPRDSLHPRKRRHARPEGTRGRLRGRRPCGCRDTAAWARGGVRVDRARDDSSGTRARRPRDSVQGRGRSSAIAARGHRR
jgi:hypothetical protein